MTSKVDAPAAGFAFGGAMLPVACTDDENDAGTDPSGMLSSNTVLRNACVHLHVVYRSTFK